ncbi:hypothetical protein ABPG72_018334 [Tetrahymena utriculariae]
MKGELELTSEGDDNHEVQKNQYIFHHKGEDPNFTYYFSSDVESYGSEHKDQSFTDHNKEIIRNPMLFIIAFVLQYFTYVIYIAFIPFIAFKDIIFEGRVDFIKERIWSWLSLWAIAYLVLTYFWFPLSSEEMHYLLEDEIYFIFTTFLVFSYLRAVDVQSSGSFKEQFIRIINVHQNICQLVYFNCYCDSNAIQLDYNSNVEFQRQSQFSAIATHYTLMEIKKIKNYLTIPIKSMVDQFSNYLPPNSKHFLILLTILAFKAWFIFLYVLKKSSLQLDNVKNLFNFLLIMFVYIYIAFNLNRALGNNDLRKKILQIERFNDLIDFQNLNQINYKKKLDVTCPISFETWDVARKFILNHKRSYLQVLEISYLTLLFYYLFVIVVCLSAYFDLDWLIPKGSALLKPVAVIINTFNFIFLSVIFMIRFNVGSEYNYSFQRLIQNVSYLQNIASDLNTMYPVFFLQDPSSVNREYRLSAYGLVTKRIKLSCSFYIASQIFYKYKVFTSKDKQELRRLLIQTMIHTLERIKESIQLDQHMFKYKFINFLEIQNHDFIFTLCLGLVPILPKIIPTFISYFRD